MPPPGYAYRRRRSSRSSPTGSGGCFRSRRAFFEIFEAEVGEPMLQQNLIARAAELAGKFDQMSPLRMRVLLLALVQRVDLRPDEVIVQSKGTLWLLGY